jgi:hypothetical protein
MKEHAVIMKLLAMSLLLMLLVAPIAVLAHGTGQHVLGTVTAIDSEHMEIKTTKGATVSVKLTKDTRFREKGNPKSTNTPAVGDRVVVEAMKDDKSLVATEVNFSAVKRVTPQPAEAASTQ